MTYQIIKLSHDSRRPSRREAEPPPRRGDPPAPVLPTPEPVSVSTSPLAKPCSVGETWNGLTQQGVDHGPGSLFRSNLAVQFWCRTEFSCGSSDKPHDDGIPSGEHHGSRADGKHSSVRDVLVSGESSRRSSDRFSTRSSHTHALYPSDSHALGSRFSHCANRQLPGVEQFFQAELHVGWSHSGRGTGTVYRAGTLTDDVEPIRAFFLLRKARAIQLDSSNVYGSKLRPHKNT